jgi:hypothetical protein
MSAADEPQGETSPPEPLLPYCIERARSSRSKCKVCRRAIEKDTPRIGVLLEGPYGTGYLWHHIGCLAKRDIAKVEEAYAGDYTKPGVEKPPIEMLREEAAKAQQKKAEKQEAPFVERASTGRSKCAHCKEPIEEGAFRFALLQSVEFYGQVRNAVVKVHADCVAKALDEANAATEIDTFHDDVRANSRLAKDDIEAALRGIELPRG